MSNWFGRTGFFGKISKIAAAKIQSFDQDVSLSLSSILSDVSSVANMHC